MKRIPFKIIAEKYLSVVDARTVMAWCKRRGLTPFKDGGQWHLFEDELNSAIASSRIDGNKKSVNLAVPEENNEQSVISLEVEESLIKRYNKIKAKAVAKERTDWATHILQQV